MLNLFTQYLHYKGFFHDLRISSIFAGILSFQRILPNFVFELKPNDQVKGELKHSQVWMKNPNFVCMYVCTHSDSEEKSIVL